MVVTLSGMGNLAVREGPLGASKILETLVQSRLARIPRLTLLLFRL